MKLSSATTTAYLKIVLVEKRVSNSGNIFYRWLLETPKGQRVSFIVLEDEQDQLIKEGFGKGMIVICEYFRNDGGYEQALSINHVQ